MNYILFNADGSIKKTNFTEVINQNSNEENQIFVSVDGLDIATHNLVGVFVLPNGEISNEAGVATSDVEYIEGVEADGYLLTLTQNETFISGLVFLTLQIKETSTNKVLYTYRVALTINESAALASVSQITLAQYNALKDYIDSNFVSDVALTSYVPYTNATNNVILGEHRVEANELRISGMAESSRIIRGDLTGYTSVSEDDMVIENGDGNIHFSADGDIGDGAGNLYGRHFKHRITIRGTIGGVANNDINFFVISHKITPINTVAKLEDLFGGYDVDYNTAASGYTMSKGYAIMNYLLLEQSNNQDTIDAYFYYTDGTVEYTSIVITNIYDSITEVTE